MASSLTTALEEMTISNEQLREEVDILKTDNTQLRTNNDTMKDEMVQLAANNDRQKDEIGQLTTLVDKMAGINQNQVSQINCQGDVIVQLRTEVQKLKVSQWSSIRFKCMYNCVLSM